MRFASSAASTAMVFLAVFLSFSLLASASHTCWSSKGFPAAGVIGKDAIGGEGISAVADQGSNSLLAFFNTITGAWNAPTTLTDFSSHAVSLAGDGAVTVAGKETPAAGCGAGIPVPCAKIKRVAGGGAITEYTFTIQGKDAVFNAKTVFLRGVLTKRDPFSRFIIADRGVAFEFNGASCAGAFQWCGKQLIESEKFTAVAPENSSVLLGTDLGKVYRLSAGPSVTLVGTISSGSVVTALAHAADGIIYAVLTDGRIFSSADNGVNWQPPIAGASLPAAEYGDLLDVANIPTRSGVALYAAHNFATYAFSNFSKPENYSAALQPSGKVRLIFDLATGSRWGYSLLNGEMLNFTCAASPTLITAGPDLVVQVGGNISTDGVRDTEDSAMQGDGVGHSRIFQWSLASPAGLGPAGIFQTYGADGGILTGINATRVGTYNFEALVRYSDFPKLEMRDSFNFTVEPAPAAPGLVCASDADCDSDQICSAGSCVARPAPSPSPTPPPSPSPSPSPGGSGTVETGSSCTSSSQCADNAECRAGACLELACTDGKIPVAHKCVATCTASSQCTAAEACVGGVCRVLNCSGSRPILVGHTCASESEVVICAGQPHNKNFGVCCNGEWKEGETQCPAPASPVEAVKQLFSPNLLPFTVVALLVVIAVMAAGVYFLVIKKPPGEGSSEAAPKPKLAKE